MHHCFNACFCCSLDATPYPSLNTENTCWLQCLFLLLSRCNFPTKYNTEIVRITASMLVFVALSMQLPQGVHYRGFSEASMLVFVALSMQLSPRTHIYFSAENASMLVFVALSMQLEHGTGPNQMEYASMLVFVALSMQQLRNI